ncbi:MAG TPA: lipase maturation factor family protein, partial [Acidobacteriaceae bacterium]|nr:lipase maturation factor family protein [Acidobacteriaceae bacterium]
GDPRRMPPQIAPYHLRLDWLIWFLPFSVAVLGSTIRVPGYDLWFLRFIQRLLTAEPAILRLMGHNPFPEQPPTYIRALFYRYRYTGPATKRQTGAWWTRELLGEYLRPISLEALKRL